MADNISSIMNMSYAELITTSNAIHVYMVRDTDQFAEYGILEADIDAFKAKIDEFEAIPTDTEMEVPVMDATADKNTIANELRILLRSIAQRAKLAFGQDEAKYNLFHTKDLSRLPDSNLLVFGRMSKRSADLYQTELSGFGLTSIMISGLNDKNDNFETSLEDQRNAIAARDAATNNRAKKAAALYELLTKYCDTGKTIWYETNEAYYNDYVIFTGSGGGALDPVTTFGYNQETNDFTWDGQVNATSYQLEMSNDNVAFSEIYSGSDIIFHYVPSESGTKYYRVRARNSGGYGEFSEVLSVTYYSSLSAPANFTINMTGNDPYAIHLAWDEVPGAEFYMLYRSIVDSGQPSGEYTYLFNVTLNPTTEPGIAGKRHYYYLKAANPHIVSPASEIRFVDVLPPP